MVANIEGLRRQLPQETLDRSPFLRAHLLAFANPLLTPKEYVGLNARQRQFYMVLVGLRGQILATRSDLKLVQTPDLIALIGERSPTENGEASLFFLAWLKTKPMYQMSTVTAPSSDEAWATALEFLGSLRYEDIDWASKDQLREIVDTALKSNRAGK
jgi:hypothetical protein